MLTMGQAVPEIPLSVGSKLELHVLLRAFVFAKIPYTSPYTHAFVHVCICGPSTIGGLDSLDWNGGLERWNQPSRTKGVDNRGARGLKPPPPPPPHFFGTKYCIYRPLRCKSYLARKQLR